MWQTQYDSHPHKDAQMEGSGGQSGSSFEVDKHFSN